MEETKELVKFVISLIKAIENSLSDSKISIGDALNFIQPALLSVGAIQNISKMPKEWTNLNPCQIAEIQEYIGSNIDKTDKVQQIIEKSFEIGIKIVELYNLIKG